MNAATGAQLILLSHQVSADPQWVQLQVALLYHQRSECAPAHSVL